jgi:hypothetical protein
VLAMAPTLVACGVFLDVADDPTSDPVRVEAGEGSTGEEDGGTILLDPDASVADTSTVDACATAAACSPEKLGTLSGGITRLVVAGGALYAAHPAASGQHVSRLANSAPGPAVDLDPYSTVPEGFRPDSNIAVDGTGAVYWGTPNGLRRHEPGVGADASTDAGVTDLSFLGAPVAGVRIAADGRLYFTVSGPLGVGAPNAGHVGSCALPGCSDVQTPAFTPYPQDVIVLGGTRWWLGFDDGLTGYVFRKQGVAISGAQLTPSRLATDGQAIYWSTTDNLRMHATGSSAVTDLIAAPTSITTRVNGITVDAAGTLYVTKQSDVLRCTITAGKCSFATVATTPGIATDIAADATHLYWGTNDGSIYRLKKP